jgi:large subunit ribosomal protein L14|tara:strand:+ start:438 stop:824 length:387 start_codon:yes stop_codon:yes gene_type:complete
MVQSGSFLNVVDNSGAKTVCCIRVSKGYKRRYAAEGDVILVSVKSLKNRRKSTSKVKKGDVLKALVVRVKVNSFDIYGKNISFQENSVVLLNNQYKPIGSRISGSLSKAFFSSKFQKVLSFSKSVIDT